MQVVIPGRFVGATPFRGGRSVRVEPRAPRQQKEWVEPPTEDELAEWRVAEGWVEEWPR